MLLVISLSLIFYAGYRAYNFLQGDAPERTYDQRFQPSGFASTTTDKEGNFINYWHSDLVTALSCTLLAVGIAIGKIF